MRIEPQPGEVRTLVLDIFRELGTPPKYLFDLEENIHLDDGRYTARSYQTDDLMAMWLIEIGLLQIYEVEGNMLRTENLLEETRPLRMAA